MMRKRIYGLLLALLCIVSLVSCRQDDTQVTSITDALKISAYVYDENGETWSFQQLRLNEPKNLVPIHILNNDESYKEADMVNFNFHFEYEDGICVMTAPDRDMQLSVGNNGDIWERGEDMTTRVYDCDNNYEIILSRPGYMAVALFGMKNFNIMNSNPENAVRFDNFKSYIGQEYYLTVTACDFDKVPVITAQVKFTSLEDEMYTDGTSRNFSIELVSYDYSDIYKMMEGAS